MHFWIDKRSQVCGFHGRRAVTPSFSGYGRNQRFCRSRYPKPMVTPVHRFQSIESVANNGLRYARGSETAAQGQTRQAVRYNRSTSNIRIPPVARSIEMISNPRNNNNPTATLKCGVWIFFAVITFFLAGAKYYFHGINIGVEALIFCSLLVIVLIIGGLISLCEAITNYTPSTTPLETAATQMPEEASSRRQPTEPAPIIDTNVEMPPPPYHIAVMLSPQNDMDSIEIIRDSPPPSYEKVVT